MAFSINSHTGGEFDGRGTEEGEEEMQKEKEKKKRRKKINYMRLKIWYEMRIISFEGKVTNNDRYIYY